MDITVFNDITTEGALLELEVRGAKYNDLLCDMDNPPERKWVKDNASEIKGLIKSVEARRISAAKKYKLAVDAEATTITDRLKAANENFTILIDTYSAGRAKVIANEKLVIKLREQSIQKELDHEFALLVNKTFEFDQAEIERVKNEEYEVLRVQAEKRASDRQVEINAAIERDRVYAENARLANVEHVRSVNISILNAMIEVGIEKEAGTRFIKMLARKELQQLTINY